MSEENSSISYDILIIGGGPAGSSAAIYAARAGFSTAVLDKGLTTGALGVAGKIANYPGVDREISGAELLEIMRAQARRFGAQYIDDKAIGTELSATPKIVYGNKNTYAARVVIIATGAIGRTNLLRGEAELLGKGVSYCAECDAPFFKDAEVAVIGRNDEAVEDALYLTRFVKTLHFISPSREIRATQALLEQLEAAQNVVFHRGAITREVLGPDKVTGLQIIEADGGAQKVLPVSGAFIYLQGRAPVTDFLQGQLDTSAGGCLLVDQDNQTNIPGVYAVGDVLCQHTKQAVLAAADGAVAAIAAGKYFRDRKQTGFGW